jgi:hypothetical protein
MDVPVPRSPRRLLSRIVPREYEADILDRKRRAQALPHGSMEFRGHFIRAGATASNRCRSSRTTSIALPLIKRVLP